MLTVIRRCCSPARRGRTVAIPPDDCRVVEDAYSSGEQRKYARNDPTDPMWLHGRRTPPNESRLSCGALKKDSFPNSMRAASFKRLLGSAQLGQQYCLGVNAPPNQPDWRNDFRPLISDSTEHAAGV